MPKTRIYRRIDGSGTYAVTGGRVRYCSTNGGWINSIYTPQDLAERAKIGQIVGPILANHFKELD